MSKIILTEKQNPNTKDIDIVSTIDMLKLINDEDKKVAVAVEKELKEIAKCVDVISDAFLEGGRLLYFGAGTSGRLGVLDASECPPTFGASPDKVIGTIAGGNYALRSAVEGAEDNQDLAIEDFHKLNVTPQDVVVAISASGNPKYLLKILEIAQFKGLKTISIVCNKEAKMKEFSDFAICVEVGAEVITGSSRLKAGTAQKMVLNMLTTGAFIKTGKTYQNYMIDVVATNNKLKDRAARIVSELADISYDKAQVLLEDANYEVKTAVVMSLKNIDFKSAKRLLDSHSGILRKALS